MCVAGRDRGGKPPDGPKSRAWARLAPTPLAPTLEPQFHGTPRFRIVSRISVGAAGELYKALDETRGTFVALRTLRNVGEDAGETLERDFRALKAVRHPSLVSLGELDCIDGLWFYTMEFVEGAPLLDY